MKTLVFCLVLTLSVVVVVEGLKYARDDPFKPVYIKDDYIQVEEKDFTTYYEWWNMTSYGELPKALLISEYDKNLSAVLVTLAHNYAYDEARYSQIFPIYNETRYFLLKSAQNKNYDNLENYDLVLPLYRGNYRNQSLLTANNSDTAPSLNDYGFMCRQYFIINTTHVIDTKKMYDLGTKKLLSFDMQYAGSIVLSQSLVQPLANIDDNCFNDAIKSKLNQCFNKNKFCAVANEDTFPELVVSSEHVIQVRNGFQLIMRLHTDLEHGFFKTAYYLLKRNDQYYYFPLSMKTAHGWNPLDEKDYRISLFPIFNLNNEDRFWNRSDVNPQQPPIIPSGNGTWSIVFNQPNISINNMAVNFGAWIGEKVGLGLN